MEESLDCYLFQRLDVYVRMSHAFEELEERFWAAVGKDCGAIADELLGTGFRNGFRESTWTKEQRGYLYHPTWVLEFDQTKEKEYSRAPGFWFPDSEYWDIPSVCGLATTPVIATIWGTPLSESAGELVLTRSAWESSVARPLAERGWVRVGERVSRPNGHWGLKHNVVLDHKEVAQGLREGDLRSALRPIEKLLEDFATVCEAIEQLVQNAKSSRRSATAKVPPGGSGPNKNRA